MLIPESEGGALSRSCDWWDWAMRTAALFAFTYGWIYFPISVGHRGDFFAMMTAREEPLSHWSGEGFGYGPIFALYEFLLRPVSDIVAMRLMFTLNHILMAAAFIILLKTFVPTPRSPRELSIAMLIWANFYPLVQAMRQNNVEVTELFFLSLGALFFSRGREGGAGIALGLAGATKVVPLLIVPYLVWRRRWRMALFALTTFTVVAAMVAWLKGFWPWNGLQTLGQAASTGWANQHINNQSLIGLTLRAFSTFDLGSDPKTAAFPKLTDAATPLALGIGLVVGSIAAVVVTFWRRVGIVARRATPNVELTEQILVLTVILLGLPFSQTHYYSLVIAGYFALIRPLASGELPPVAKGAAVASFGLLGLLAPMRLLDPVVLSFSPLTMPELWKLWSLPCAGGILLAVALSALHQQQAIAVRPRDV